MGEVRKAVAALLTAVSTWGVTAIAEGGIDGAEWFGLLGVVASVLAVYNIPNVPQRAPRPLRAPGRGATTVEVAVIVAATLVAVYLLLQIVGHI